MQNWTTYMDRFGQIEIPNECVGTSLRCAGLTDLSKVVYELGIGRSSFRITPQECRKNTEIDPKWEVPADPRKPLLLRCIDNAILAEFWGNCFQLSVDSSTGTIKGITLAQDEEREPSGPGSPSSATKPLWPEEDSIDPSDLPGFKRIGGELAFTPLLEPSGFFADETIIASMDHPLNAYLWKKIESQVESNDSLEWLGAARGLMVENWLLVALMNSGWHLVLIYSIAGKDLASGLLDTCEYCINNGLGLRPTLALPWECEGELYSAAEEIESCIRDFERAVHIFTVSICLRKERDINDLLASWKEQGWTEEIDAINNYCKSANE